MLALSVPCGHFVRSSKNFRRLRWTTAVAVIAIVGAALIATPSIGRPFLRGVGWLLVTSEALAPVDLIVVSLDSNGAGALEAADLVHGGTAARVAVFADSPSVEDYEFIRRGLPYEDASARQIRQLNWLGVKDLVLIPFPFHGSRSAGEALARWCREHGIGSIVVVTARDHSRRVQRVLKREMRGQATRFTVQPSRYSRFDPDRWWQTQEGIRIALSELQKLMLDFLLHPAIF